MLLRSKLEPPRVFGHALERDRITNSFAPETIAHVTLVHAPAGFGKTTLLREVYNAYPRERAAWLTIDPGDNDPGRFLFHLMAALGAAEPGKAVETAGLDNISTTADQLSHLSEVLISLPEGFCLFLDELDQLTVPPALAVVARIMRDLPNSCSLILGGRTYPDLPFGRLRMHGQLREIGAGELRFTLEEIEAVLRLEMPGLEVSRDALEKLYTATEGWVGSIQMAILSARSTQNIEAVLTAFNGTNAELAEYLAEDILARQTSDMQAFLLATSVLDQFSADLCDTILGRDDSAVVIQSLARSNTFLSSYDNETNWFRYHNLFRSFLRARAEEQGARYVRDLQSTAAKWFADLGRPSTAISYALEAGDFALAANLVDHSVMDFFYAGRLSTIANWVRPLPENIRDRYPQIMLAYVWSLIAQQEQPETIVELIANLEARTDVTRELRNEIIYLGPFHAAQKDQLEGLDRTCVDAMGRDTEISAFSRGVLWNIVSYARMLWQDFAGAADAAREARSAHRESGSVYGLSYAEGFLGRIELLQGRVQSALAHAAATRTIASGSRSETLTRMCVAMLEARLTYETGDNEAAQAACVKWRDMVEALAPPHELIDLFLIQADLEFDRGDTAAAYRLLNRLRQIGRARGHARMEASAWVLQAQMAARRGDLTAAQEYLLRAEQCETLRRFDSALLAESKALVELVAGDHGAARQTIESAGARLRQEGSVLALMRLLVLRVELELLAGELSEADPAMDEVLELVRREGLLRPVLRAPGAVRRALVKHAIGRQMDLTQAQIERIDPAKGRTQVTQSTNRQALPLEPLSRREAEVLTELSKGLSNQGIADALSVSLPTVKTHLRNVFGKLMASNRTEAVATARRLDLISGV